jgi:hypothetical protein
MKIAGVDVKPGWLGLPEAGKRSEARMARALGMHPIGPRRWRRRPLPAGGRQAERGQDGELRVKNDA